jgi:hypothetical protein
MVASDMDAALMLLGTQRFDEAFVFLSHAARHNSCPENLSLLWGMYWLSVGETQEADLELRKQLDRDPGERDSKKSFERDRESSWFSDGGKISHFRLPPGPRHRSPSGRFPTCFRLE